jgi:hypothetical protein
MEALALESLQGLSHRATRRKNDYIKALKAGESVTEVREDWARFQAAREGSSLPRQPMFAQQRAPLEQDACCLLHNENKRRETESWQ